MVFYFSVNAYTLSIETVTEKQVSQLVQRIAEQTETLCLQIVHDMEQLSTLPYVQIAFVEYQNTHRLNLLREKLDRFRNGRTLYERITLFTNHGRVLAANHMTEQTSPNQFVLGKNRSMAGVDDVFYKIFKENDQNHIAIFKRVYDFQEQHQPVGFVSVLIPLDHVVAFLERLEMGPDSEKLIVMETGEPVFSQNEFQRHEQVNDKKKEYAAQIPVMNWRILLRIPERELFKDVHQLVQRNLFFMFVVLLLAMGASFFFSRREIHPLTEIINGTREFAAGNLDHRIQTPSGIEVRRLSNAFNQMAKQLKERQLELIKSNKLAALGLLIAGIAHEIKNPLAGIKTTAQVMVEVLQLCPRHETQVNLDENDYYDIKGMAQDIGQEVNRLNKIVTDLLNFAKPRPSRITRCDMKEIVDDCLRILQKEIKNRKITISNEVRNCISMADRDQMVQVFINLLLNAISIVAPGTGIISLASFKNESTAPVIIIKDNGPGIPEEKVDHIFDPFFSMSGTGTGLGLSIVYTLLAQNNARIKVSSRVGNGTQFQLTFKEYHDREPGDG
ncbi:ATP-binding protein [Desulforapulum autotrophicum]|nr:ATP-binding protein [Desulforapulum autotrophicum]